MPYNLVFNFQRPPGTIDRSLARKTLLPDSSDEEEEEDAVPGTPPSKRVGVKTNGVPRCLLDS